MDGNGALGRKRYVPPETLHRQQWQPPSNAPSIGPALERLVARVAQAMWLDAPVAGGRATVPTPHKRARSVAVRPLLLAFSVAGGAGTANRADARENVDAPPKKFPLKLNDRRWRYRTSIIGECYGCQRHCQFYGSSILTRGLTVGIGGSGRLLLANARRLTPIKPHPSAYNSSRQPTQFELVNDIPSLSPIVSRWSSLVSQWAPCGRAYWASPSAARQPEPMRQPNPAFRKALPPPLLLSLNERQLSCEPINLALPVCVTCDDQSTTISTRDGLFSH